jgi:alkylation response protein AidB-like acyl-CoA dehydrogenase
MVTSTHVAPQAELVRRVAELVPLLRKNAEWAEENGRPHEVTVAAMAETGIFRMRVPARYGGQQSPAQVLVEVAAELGRGDASAAWATSAWWMASWLVEMFPEPVQAEVFDTPDVRVCGTLSAEGTAASRPGGAVLNGRWRAVSGARDSHWQQVVAISAAPDGTPDPVLALVPTRELQLVEEHLPELAGAGAATTIATEVLVPAERVLRLGAVLRDRHRPTRAAAPAYRTPLLAIAAASSVGTMIGLAKAAQDDAFERLLAGRAGFPPRAVGARAGSPGRPPVPPARPRLAGAATMTDQAESRAHRIASLIDAKELSRTAWTVDERDRIRGDFASACRLAIQAVDLASRAVPVPAGRPARPPRQLARDVRAVHRRALADLCGSLDLVMRLLSSLEPATFRS